MEINIKELRRMTRLVNKVLENNPSEIKKIHFRGIPIEKLLDDFAETVEKLYVLNIEMPPLILSYYNETFVGEESDAGVDEFEDPLPSKIEPILDLAFTSLEEGNVIPKKSKPKPKPKPKVEKPKKRMGRPPKPKVEKPKKKRKTRAYSVRKLKPNSMVAVIAKIVKDNPKISRMELLDILKVEFPDKTIKTLGVTISQTFYAIKNTLKLFGIEVD